MNNALGPSESDIALRMLLVGVNAALLENIVEPLLQGRQDRQLSPFSGKQIRNMSNFYLIN